MIAAPDGDLEIAEALLSHGANTNLSGEDVLSVITDTPTVETEYPVVTRQAQRRQAALVRLLRAHGAKKE